MSGTSSVVLLIEPHDQLSTVYADALRDSGFTVIVVPDTPAALYALIEITPQIVIARFDSRTHDECLAFVERLKEDPRTRHVPILLTSEIITDNDLQRATEMNVLEIAVGPHDSLKMAAAVRGVLTVAEGKGSA